MIDDPLLKNADLSFIKMITYGGDSMEPADKVRINEFLRRHNCKVKLTKGHGMSETCGCSAYSDGEYNVLGAMGIPMPFSVYGVVNPETKEPVNFEGREEIEGELVISTPLLTPGELDGKKYINTIMLNGERFILTKDIAVMRNDGVMRFLQRSDRGFTRFDGYKVKPYEIEKVIKNDSRVKYCVITPYYDEHRRGNMVMATIVLEDGIVMSVQEQKDYIENLLHEQFISNPNISSRQIPTKFHIVESLPLTANSKVDYKQIIAQGVTGDEIDVIIEENNISISNIVVRAPEGKRLKKSK
jgi:long-chain acyl-CoA synthetase